MAQCDSNDLIAQACESGFTCRNEPELLALLNQLLCNLQGTVAVSGGYPVILSNSTASPTLSDSVTLYLGLDVSVSSAGLQTFDNVSIRVPKSGTITSVFVKVKVGNPGTSETVEHFIRVNDAIDVGQVDLAYDANQQSGTAIVSHPVVAGDMIALKVVTPAWATNPTAPAWYAMVFIE